MAKRASQVRFGSDQSGWWVKQVASQNGSFLSGSIGLRVGSGLPIFFKQVFFFFFFFDLKKQINDNLFRDNE